jgi:hypothetical protein
MMLLHNDGGQLLLWPLPHGVAASWSNGATSLPPHCHLSTTSLPPQCQLTPTSLPPHSHLTPTSLPPHYHSLPPHCHLTATSLPPHCSSLLLTPTSLPPHSHLTPTSLPPHYHLTPTSLPPHCCSWWSHGAAASWSNGDATSWGHGVAALGRVSSPYKKDGERDGNHSARAATKGHVAVSWHQRHANQVGDYLPDHKIIVTPWRPKADIWGEYKVCSFCSAFVCCWSEHICLVLLQMDKKRCGASPPHQSDHPSPPPSTAVAFSQMW